jgi:hypothetical protein
MAKRGIGARRHSAGSSIAAGRDESPPSGSPVQKELGPTRLDEGTGPPREKRDLVAKWIQSARSHPLLAIPLFLLMLVGAGSATIEAVTGQAPLEIISGPTDEAAPEGVSMSPSSSPVAPEPTPTTEPIPAPATQDQPEPSPTSGTPSEPQPEATASPVATPTPSSTPRPTPTSTVTSYVFPAKADLDGRTTKDINDRDFPDMYRQGEGIQVVCQSLGGEAYGSRIWDYTVEGVWVPDKYVLTGTDGWAPGVPRCP